MDTRGEVWTAQRVAEVIDRTFGVRSHRDYVGHLLCEADWSRQQPIARAKQRDEQAIQDWYEERWPAIKKSTRGATGDHLGRRSWVVSLADGGARLGTTRSDAGAASAADAGSPDRAICGITLDGRLFLHVRPVSYAAAAVVGAPRVPCCVRVAADSS
jgi:Winged helix-turn helix